MKVVYLAGPYTHKDPMVRELRYLSLLRAEKYLLDKDIVVISPINMCHELSQIYNMQHTYDYWQDRDRTLISRCDEVVVLKETGWEESIGVTDEIMYAKELSIPVTYIEVEEMGDVE